MMLDEDALKATIAKLLAAEQRGKSADTFRAWAAETPGAAELADEWAAMCERHGKDEAIVLGTRKDGERTVYVLLCENGRHESYDSHVAALADMVEAHR